MMEGRRADGNRTRHHRLQVRRQMLQRQAVEAALGVFAVGSLRALQTGRFDQAMSKMTSTWTIFCDKHHLD